MAPLFLILFSICFVIISQKRRHVRSVTRSYKERIARLEKRRQEVQGDALLAVDNQLRFLKRGYQEYLSEKSRFF